MKENVRLTQLRFIAACFTADLAFEGFFAPVHPLMIVALAFGLEDFAAVAAVEGSVCDSIDPVSCCTDREWSSSTYGLSASKRAE